MTKEIRIITVIQYFHAMAMALKETIINIPKEPPNDLDRYKPKYRENESADCQPCTKPHQGQDGTLLLIPGQRPKPDSASPDQAGDCDAKDPLGIKDRLPASIDSGADPTSCCSSMVVGHEKIKIIG
jgi:hypothetical protein